MCSQAMLTAYAAAFGMDRQAALKVSGAFGGGMGRMGEICGAVTGAFMVIGLKFGRTDVKDAKSHEETNRLVKGFTERFKQRNGSIVCRELLGCDLITEEGRKIFIDDKFRDTKCVKFVRDAAEIIEEILA